MAALSQSAASTTNDSEIDLTPFKEPPYLAGLPSPYFNETHYRFQKALKQWYNHNYNDWAGEWEDAGAPSPDLFGKFVQANMVGAFLWLA